jgi:hypothetical protein
MTIAITWPFLATNWIWILLIGGMLFVHLRHRRGGRGVAAAAGTWTTPAITASSSLAPRRFPSADFDVVLPTRQPRAMYSWEVVGLALNAWLAPVSVPPCSAPVAEGRGRALVLVSDCSCR